MSERREFVRKIPFESFLGKETRFKVEARGGKPEHLVGVMTGHIADGAITFVQLDDGKRLIRVNSIVDVRLQADYLAECEAHPFPDEVTP